jgi:hypothetical protein
MHEISKFWVEVVGVDQPIKPPKAKGRRRLGADEQLEQAAEAAAYKAQIMHRLADLVKPYKEAVTSDPRGAAPLQKLYEAVRTSIEGREFKKAAKDLDTLERLVDEACAEKKFGGTDDLSQVRVHTDGATAETNNQLGAEAYTTSDNVAFGQTDRPTTSTHEAPHVVQRGPDGQGAPEPTPKKKDKGSQ